MDEHDLAWAAGFFDGDGWAGRVKNRRGTRPQARINQGGSTDVPEVLVRFRTIVGVGKTGGPIRKPGRRDLYWWSAGSRDDIGHVARLIGPWLSADKRRQFAAAIDVCFEGSARSSVAWAAGLFDAEGCVSLSGHRSHPGYKVIEATVTQGGNQGIPEELARFASLVACGRVNGPYAQKGANELVYRWRVHTLSEVCGVIALLRPWLGDIKRRQAGEATAVIEAQPPLPRGRPDWGSHKTHCVHGHEYATARIRPYRSRGVGKQRRDSKQCLVCARDQARASRTARKQIGSLPAADREDPNA